jgi:Zn-finger protein
MADGKSRHQPQRPVREFGVTRANEPALYRCHRCGETLSGPGPLYCYCPGTAAMQDKAREVKVA